MAASLSRGRWRKALSDDEAVRVVTFLFQWSRVYSMTVSPEHTHHREAPIFDLQMKQAVNMDN